MTRLRRHSVQNACPQAEDACVSGRTEAPQCQETGARGDERRARVALRCGNAVSDAVEPPCLERACSLPQPAACTLSYNKRGEDQGPGKQTKISVHDFLAELKCSNVGVEAVSFEQSFNSECGN
eukprot:2851172-Rhodomonas_salina.2